MSGRTTRSARLLALAGDGIGPEITQATLDVLAAAGKLFGLDLAIEPEDIGFKSLEVSGVTITDAVVERARAADGVILGPVSHNDYPPVSQGGKNPSGVLRKSLDLYANVRPARTRRGLAHITPQDFDLVIVRENTEGFYADRSMVAGTGEFKPTDDVALAIRKITALGSRRIAEYAFELAARRSRKVVAVHKANVMRVTDGLFLDEVRAVASAHPDIAYSEQLVDSMAALLIRQPESFDVIVAGNMFGDILSDEASELSGSLGLAASLNLSRDHAVAQAQHGSAPGLAGRDKANPGSLVGSAAMLLRWLGARRDEPAFIRAGNAIEAALDDAIAGGPDTRTADLGGALGTRAFTDAVVARLREGG